MLSFDRKLMIAKFSKALESGDADVVKRTADELDKVGTDPVAVMSEAAMNDEATSQEKQVALRVLEILDKAAFRNVQRTPNVAKVYSTEAVGLSSSDEQRTGGDPAMKWVFIGLILLAILWPAYSIYRFNNPRPAKPSKVLAQSSNYTPPGVSPSSGSAPGASSDLGQSRISGSNRFGCSDREYFEKIGGYAVQRDKAAFSQALVTGVAIGTCTIFDSGELVFVTDNAVFSGLIEVRRHGDIQEFWTNIEAVD